ncbi:HNH endonuclease [Clostridium sp. HCP1S3_B4]|uniref:HNH endonuclease n=1 Tax=unclassified Clostridium TaxID=2614128 RepID=UPI003F8B6F88
MLYFDNGKIRLNNRQYTIQTSALSNIVDSFVAPSNKVGNGSGEARLYVSSQSVSPIFNFNPNISPINKGNKSYIACSHPCFLSRDNLFKYMEDAEIDYFSPNNHYRKDLSLLYNDRLDLISALPDEIYFHVYNQNGALDSSRFYIGSVDDAWSLIRELSLPKLTCVTIYKLINDSDPSDILYYFELNHISNLSHPLTYSRNHLTSTLTTEISDQIQNDTTISKTERETLITSRLGQGKFRLNVLSIMPQCPFTGISEPFLLRASHIIPWACCSNNHDRLDGYNGLTLTPTYDVLFDKGYISFTDNGQLMVSPFLPNNIRLSLNLFEGQVYNINNINGARNIYLEYHRNHIFKSKE